MVLMKIVRSAHKLTEIMLRIKERGSSVGFVPTMGFLHEGHLSLVRQARKENDVVVVSIFVNSIQFGPREDFRRYPRNVRRDAKLLRKERVDFLFVPSRRAVYPPGFCDFMAPGPLARGLCGAKRPGHFKGVLTVVKRLFDIVKPRVAYFGLKDFQQARVIQEMVKRLRLPVEIKTAPIIRESDGLAMSSRNAYLSEEERKRARALFLTLRYARSLIRGGMRDARRLKRNLRIYLEKSVSKVDYVEVVDPHPLQPVKQMTKPVLVALACYVGSTRLIDNALIKI